MGIIIARNAQRIAEARQNGYRPNEMIIVSLIGRINESNWTVHACPGKEYDWRWARGLLVCLYTSPDVDWQPVAHAIALQRPSFFAIWDVDNREGAYVYLQIPLADIDKPPDQQRLMLDLLPWHPIQNKEFAWS